MSQSSLHIVHVVYRFDTGGLENGVVNLINSLGNEEYTHSIVTLKGHNADFAARIKTANVKYYDLAKRDGNDLGIFWRMNQLLKQLKPDILHTRNTATLEMQLVGWWRRVKLRIHGEHGWDVNDMHGQNLTYQRLRKLLKPFIHQYVALSSEAKLYLLNIIKVKPNRINHICNGVDTNKFSPGEKDEVGLPENFMRPELLVFGTVGRLAEVKNQTLLLESFIALIKRHGNKADKLRLIMVGDGLLLNSLVARTTSAGLTKQVYFAGNRSDVAQLMKHFNVFVLPSLAEGISNTILEAMASGLPVIATQVGGNPDLIKQTLHESHLVKATDGLAMVSAMEQYIDRGDLLRLNSKEVREHCKQNFSIDTMVNKYHQLYQTFNG